MGNKTDLQTLYKMVMLRKEGKFLQLPTRIVEILRGRSMKFLPLPYARVLQSGTRLSPQKQTLKQTKEANGCRSK